VTDETEQEQPQEQPQPRKIRVGVLFGGQSAEHAVSLASAASIMRALDPARYEVLPIGIARAGGWLVGGDPMKALRSGAPADPAPAALPLSQEGPEDRAQERGLAPRHAAEPPVTAAARTLDGVDVIFPVLHGPFGEDGTIQGLLEVAGVAYVGAGVLGSALGMDKIAMKMVFQAAGLPVGPYLAVTRAQWEAAREAVQARCERALGYPMFAKPANLGSSVGISKIHGPAEFAAALDRAARYDRRLLIEQGLAAREIECSVLGNDHPIASVCGEIVPRREFYDYRAKYLDEGSELIIPADLPERVSDEVRRLAVAAFQAIDGAGMARVDFFVTRDLHRVYLNEINTIPGFTAISMYPKLWEASGLSYPELLDRLITLALERFEERRRPPSAGEDDDEARTIAGESLPV
jgi:D-alanine-D-alanine ligase